MERVSAFTCFIFAEKSARDAQPFYRYRSENIPYLLRLSTTVILCHTYVFNGCSGQGKVLVAHILHV